MTSDLQVLLALDNTDADLARFFRYDVPALIASWIDRDAEKFQPVANIVPHASAVFADASGKDKHIQPAQHCGIGRDHFLNGHTKNLDGLLSLFFPAVSGGFKIAH